MINTVCQMYLFKDNLTITTKVINLQWGNLANTTLNDEVSGHICPLLDSLKGIKDHKQLWHCQKCRALVSTRQVLSEH